MRIYKRRKLDNLKFVILYSVFVIEKKRIEGFGLKYERSKKKV